MLAHVDVELQQSSVKRGRVGHREVRVSVSSRHRFVVVHDSPVRLKRDSHL